MKRSMLSSSFFEDVIAAELHGRPVQKKPHLGGLSSESAVGTGVLTLDHQGTTTPPLAVSFCKTSRRSHLLLVSDEDGYVGFYDTRRRLPSLASSMQKTGEALVREWVAHNNAIFDVCWIKDDTQILTASGDQTIKIWDAENGKCAGLLTGHSGSVKSISTHSSNADLLVSGSRDGSFALWDLRCNSSSRNNCGEAQFKPAAIVKEAHPNFREKRTRRTKAASMSITSVLYLKDEITIATAGAVGSEIKFWDTRCLKSSVANASPHALSPSEKERAVHGISSLSQDPNGVFLAASCMDNRIYMYDILRLDKDPCKIFSGSKIGSFYVKSAISPDGAHILGGSSDGSAYIWQVNKPERPPVLLNGHEGEVTAVDCLLPL